MCCVTQGKSLSFLCLGFLLHKIELRGGILTDFPPGSSCKSCSSQEIGQHPKVPSWPEHPTPTDWMYYICEQDFMQQLNYRHMALKGMQPTPQALPAPTNRTKPGSWVTQGKATPCAALCPAALSHKRAKGHDQESHPCKALTQS